jgi:hypothetical protein
LMEERNMSELQKAIEEITYVSKKFPGKAFEIISANRKEALPYLRSALEKAVAKKNEMDENYQLYFYALFLMGEFQDREIFPKIIELVSLPGEVLDELIGDAVTSGLKDILYNTYNGDIELLKNTVTNSSVDEFVRADLLEVMGQLYLDGLLGEKEWKTFIKQNVYCGEKSNYMYCGLGNVICRCHFVDMLPEIRYMLDNGLMDEFCLGAYDSCVDHMFAYRIHENNFCESPMKAADILKDWAMFEQDTKEARNKMSGDGFEKLMKKAPEKVSAHKVGRNDPCPCGSGKKYKFCCMNKSKSPIDLIESAGERQKWLKNYPYLGGERQKGKVYLEDYFDSESIEIDKLLYLGLMHRPGLIWLRNEKAEENRCREYLILAFQQFIDKVEKEGIKDFAAYDQKYSIHYFCEEWMSELLRLLKNSEDKSLYASVKKCRKEMGN